MFGWEAPVFGWNVPVFEIGKCRCCDGLAVAPGRKCPCLVGKHPCLIRRWLKGTSGRHAEGGLGHCAWGPTRPPTRRGCAPGCGRAPRAFLAGRVGLGHRAVSSGRVGATSNRLRWRRASAPAFHWRALVCMIPVFDWRAPVFGWRHFQPAGAVRRGAMESFCECGVDAKHGRRGRRRLVVSARG